MRYEQKHVERFWICFPTLHRVPQRKIKCYTMQLHGPQSCTRLDTNLQMKQTQKREQSRVSLREMEEPV